MISRSESVHLIKCIKSVNRWQMRLCPFYKLKGVYLLKSFYNLSYQHIQQGDFDWHWKEYGSGSKLLLAFHGFNRSPDDFHSFEKWLGQEYTILAFDLFYHGKSAVRNNHNNMAINLLELKSLIDEVLFNYNKEVFEIVAYSFGGRLALNLVEIYGKRVQGLYLMAPDAMRFNPGFFFMVQNVIGRFLFRYFLRKPDTAIKIMKATASLGFYNKNAMAFFVNHIEYEPLRYKVFNVWMLHRGTVPNLNKIAAIIKNNQIRLLLFFGKYDKVILPKTGVRFARMCNAIQSFHLLEIGHRLPEKHEEICNIIKIKN